MTRYWIFFCALLSRDCLATDVIAHRGYSCVDRENTVQSVVNAWQVGASAVELDLRVSNNGIVYVFHDEAIDGARLSALDYSEIQQLAGSRAPQLDSVLSLEQQSGYYVLDVKERERIRIKQIVATIAASKVNLSQVMFQSEHLATLKLLRRLLPDSRLLFLTHLKRQFPYLVAPNARQIVRKLQGSGVDGVSIKGRSYVDRKFVAVFKTAGYRVNVWTINDPVRADHYRNLGVDGIITDQVEGILGVDPESALVAPKCAKST